MDPSIPLSRRATAEGPAAFALVFAGCRTAVTDATDLATTTTRER
jgi:hypothetical protein